MTENTDERYQQAKKVTLIGSAIDFLLGVAKLIFGVVDDSQALVADGIHSLSDLATDVMVIVAMKQGGQEPDEEHPYGHGRIETLATTVLGLALIVVALGIGQEAVVNLTSGEVNVAPGWYALSVAIISVAAKEWIYRYTMVVAKKLDSDLLKANAWHSRTDAISSLIVIVGILGSMAGFYYLDALAAIGVAFMVAKIGWGLLLNSANELIDTGLDAESVEAISRTIIETEGVEDLHLLRTRTVGAGVLIDVHIIVNSSLTVSEGHWIGEEVRRRVTENHADIQDITIHCDPENDEESALNLHLPLRAEVQKLLKQSWEGIEEAAQVEKINLHYLGGSIYLEIVLPLSLVTTPEQAQTLVSEFSARSIGAIAEIADVKVLFSSQASQTQAER